MLISLLIFVLVIGVIFWAFQSIAGVLGMPPQITVVVRVVLVVVVLFYLLRVLGGAHVPNLL